MNAPVTCFMYEYQLRHHNVRPDFAHKYFGDKRTIYVLLMVALAQDCSFVSPA